MTTDEITVAEEPIPKVEAVPGAKAEEIDWDLVQSTLCYLAADYIARSTAHRLSFLGDYTWLVGVSLCYALALFVISRFTLSRSELGMIWKLKPASVPFCLLCILFLGAVGAYAGMFRDVEVCSFAKNLHHVLLSPVAEELEYRGIALALFSRAFGPHRGTLWPLLITSTCFSIIHLPIQDGGSLMDLLRFGYFMAVGLILGAIRVRSGSLLFPVLGHIAINGTIAICYLLRQ